MRLNNAFFRNAPNQYLGLVDAYAVDRVEVVRGSAPSMHGADAMGGVVQVLTAEPVLDGDAWRHQGRIYASYNSVDESVTTRASAAVGKDGSTFSGGVTWQDYGDRKTGNGSVVSPTAFEVRAGDIKWRQDLSMSSELMLSAQVLEQPSTPRIDELTPGFGQQQASSEVYEFRPNRRSFLHARYRLHSESPWFERMVIHIARQVITDDRLTRDFGDPVQVSEDNSSTLDGFTMQFDSPWGGQGSDQMELVWGWEYYTDTVKSTRSLLDTGSGQNTSSQGRFPDDSRMESTAFYAANRWQFGRLTLKAGLRYSAFEIRLPAGADVAKAKLQPHDLTGDLHVAWALHPDLVLVTNIGRGFRPPNIFDLGTLGSRPGNRFNEPNSNLRPESVWSYDLGLKSAGARWEAELFLFYSDYRDKITSVFTGTVTPQGRQVVRSENLNRAKIYGVESGLQWRSNTGWEAYAVVNFTRGEEKDISLGTVPADRVPPLNGRLGLIYSPGGALRLQAWGDFSGRQNRLSPRDAEDPRIAPGGTSGFVTFNMLMSWQAASGREFGVRLENLADRYYREHGSGIDAPGRNIGFWCNVPF
jgi:outer membrane receptor protein involved in Fe transport